MGVVIDTEGARPALFIPPVIAVVTVRSAIELPDQLGHRFRDRAFQHVGEQPPEFGGDRGGHRRTGYGVDWPGRHRDQLGRSPDVCLDG